MNTFFKAVAEQRVFVFSYANFPEILGSTDIPGQTLQSAEITVQGDDALTVGSPTVGTDQISIEVLISDGTAGQAYLINCLATTSGAQILACPGQLQIQEFLNQ